MENHHSAKQNRLATVNLVKSALVAALYVLLTLPVASFSFGAIQFRLSEIMNFLGMHHKRYIYAVTLGVFLANILNPSSYGAVDMVVGSAQTFIFVSLSRYVGTLIAKRLASRGQQVNVMLIRYISLIVIFSLSMFVIAAMICHFEHIWPLFWPTYLSLIASEAFVLLIGAITFYPLSKRVDFDH